MKPFIASIAVAAFASCAIAAPSKKIAGSFDSFLSGARTDFKVSLQAKNQREFGEGASMNPIEGLQLRFAQNETIEDRKYTARLKPKGYEQMRLMSALNSNQGRIESLNSQKAMTDSLFERYMAASEYVVAYETHRLWGEIAKLRTKRMSMVQAAARSSASSAVNLIEQREKLEEAEVKQGLADSDLRVATAKLKALEPTFVAPTPSLDDLPTPADMLKTVTGASPSSLAAEIAKEQASRATNALNYETAKDTRLIEFVELSYDQFNVGKQLGFRVALNVPGVSGTDPSRSEKARQLVKYEVEARQSAREEEILQTSAREALARSADLYKSMESLESQPAEQRMRRLVGRQDPLLAIALQEDGMKRQLRKIEVASKAFESYFGYLASSGTLASRSNTNFLSRSLREIAP